MGDGWTTRGVHCSSEYRGTAVRIQYHLSLLGSIGQATPSGGVFTPGPHDQAPEGIAVVAPSACGTPEDEGRWAHVALIRDSGRNFRLYVNGVQVAEALIPEDTKVGHLEKVRLGHCLNLVDLGLFTLPPRLASIVHRAWC